MTPDDIRALLTKHFPLLTRGMAQPVVADLHSAWERETKELVEQKQRDINLLTIISERAAAAEARVKELFDDMVAMIGSTGLEPEPEWLKHPATLTLRAQLAASEARVKELERLIASGSSRGAEIRPFIRRIFSVGSQAAAERDRQTMRAEAAEARLAALTEALEATVNHFIDGKPCWCPTEPSDDEPNIPHAACHQARAALRREEERG